MSSYSKNYKLSKAKKFSIKLSSIADIKAGGRWNTCCESAQDPGTITSICRTLWYIDENKHLNLKDIYSTVNDAMELIQELTLNENCCHSQSAIEALMLNLSAAYDGISNLRITYYDDTETLTDIDKILLSIQIFMNEQMSKANQLH